MNGRTGVVLSVGNEQYAVPADLRRWLRLRDGTCRFPGCTRPAARSDIDHTKAWEHGGPTDHDNLAHLCRMHHRLKHHTLWAVEQEPGGVLVWTSPAGQTTAPTRRPTSARPPPRHPNHRKPRPPSGRATRPKTRPSRSLAGSAI
ncbi:MAG: endonuclease [Cryobacterium sp.]|nr:endonuclease [Cryobacterium sp.]